jgi:hypothetical protein
MTVGVRLMIKLGLGLAFYTVGLRKRPFGGLVKVTFEKEAESQFFLKKTAESQFFLEKLAESQFF